MYFIIQFCIYNKQIKIITLFKRQMLNLFKLYLFLDRLLWNIIEKYKYI